MLLQESMKTEFEEKWRRGERKREIERESMGSEEKLRREGPTRTSCFIGEREGFEENQRREGPKRTFRFTIDVPNVPVMSVLF